MSTATRDGLYNLLPAIYRIRDAGKGEPLRALMAVIETEFQRIENDIDGLYDNWFIETCDEWVVPYIGDLLGVPALQPVGSEGTYSHRPYVANTLAYRRRKGTATVLEQLARDVTGWPARAVEFFQLLGSTQHMNHVRLSNYRTPDLRDAAELELVDTPFDSTTRTVDVRHISSGRGRHNIMNVGLFLWRVQAYAIARVASRAVTSPSDGRFTLSPLGYDLPVFNPPQTETEITQLAEEINVPTGLRRRLLYDEIEAYRESIVDGTTPEADHFGEDPAVEVFADSDSEPLTTEEIVICDLSEWDKSGWTAPVSASYTRADGSSFQTQLGLDPELGRLTLLTGATATAPFHVSYSYGGVADVGGGPYNRTDSVTESMTRDIEWQVGVSKEFTAVGDESISTTLTEAVAAWNQAAAAAAAGLVGVISILDNQTYEENLTGTDAVEIPPGCQLFLLAAGWPEVELSDGSGATEREVGQVVAEDLRPHIRGDVAVRGTADEEDASPGELILDGLLIEGKMEVEPGNLGKLRIAHCTLVPDLGGVVTIPPASPDEADNDQLQVKIHRSIVGPISLIETVPQASIEDSIVDVGGSLSAIQATGTAVAIDASTILGSTGVRSIEASNTLFTAVVVAERRQTGCMRFSYLPDGSRTPRRYKCQPELAVSEADPGEEEAILARLKPAFTSRDHRHFAYSQLGRTCPDEIRTGAEDGSEMGVFRYLKQPQREANLKAALAQYLRFGLEAGISYVT